MQEWIKAGTGIRYREHPSRKHGINRDRYYLYYYRVDGELVQEGLGWLSEGWTQEKVANTRFDMKKSAKNGGPRTLAEMREKSRLDEAAALTVNDALKEFWGKELAEKKSGTETKRLLAKDVLPVWGQRKVADVTCRDIVLLLDKIKDRDAPILRNRVHGALTRFFNFCAERGMIDDSPCTRIKKVKEKGRKRVLDNAEIKLLWKALDPEKTKPMDAYRLTKLALRMVLLTGQRPGEVTGMKWDEIEGDVWHIPESRMKNSEAHYVPLTDLALETLEQAKTLSSDSEFVFRSTHREGPMSAHALSRAIVSHRKRYWYKRKVHSPRSTENPAN